MAPIKFRQPIFDATHRFVKWHYWGVIGGQFINPAGYVYWPHPDTNTSNQFTSIKDKRGKEIWEGDIVIVSYGTGEVIFEQGAFLIKWIDDKEANMELLGFECKEPVEVIGNIYENPELLK